MGLFFLYHSTIPDMAMRCFLPIFVFIFAISGNPTARLYAQVKLSVGATAGYASFSMKDLKAYQREKLLQFDLPMKVVDEFPPYLNYGANFTVNTKSGLFEAFLGHTSTGGRIHYGDYSGYASEELLAKMTYVGLMAATRLFKVKSVGVYGGIQALHYFNTLKINDTEVLYDSDWNQYNSFSVKSMNIAFAPVIEIQHQVKKFLLKTNISYEMHVCGSLAYDENGDYTLKNASEDDVKLDPSGIRWNLGIGYILN
mgnify:CR=1 FL=1